MKITILLSALMLCAVSLACSILLWVSMPVDQTGKVLAGVTATALEVCKFAFFPAGLYIMRSNQTAAVSLWILGAVLLVISVAATVGFLESAYQQQTQKQQQSSIAWVTKQQQLNSLQQQIDTLNNMIRIDGETGYRQRGYENANAVQNLERNRADLLTELETLRGSPQGSAQSLFYALADVLNASPTKARQAAFTALAFIVDICGIAALLLVSGLSNRKHHNNAVVNKPTPSKALTSEHPPQVNKEKRTDKLLSHEEDLAARILAGEFGQPPSVRDISNTAKGGHATANKVLQHLLDENRVTRKGKRYHLVQAVIN